MRQSRQLRIVLTITMIVVTMFIVIIAIKTKGILDDTQTQINASDEKVKVTILTSDVIVDQSWGSLAYKGKLKIENDFPVEVNLISELDKDDVIEEKTSEAIAEGSVLIIGHGREFSDVFTRMAASNSDVHFITIHGTSKYANQSVYSFDQGDIEYFAALAATLKSKNNKIAVLDAIDNRKNNLEFEKGVKYYKPNASYYYEFVESRDDGDKALEIMKVLINRGVDVIYSKGNSFNSEVINAAKEHGIYVIGYLDDQSYMGVDHVLTSVLNDIPQVYVAIMEDYFSKEGIPSGKVVLSQSDNIYYLAPLGPMFTDAERSYLETEILKFNQGELTFQ